MQLILPPALHSQYSVQSGVSRLLPTYLQETQKQGYGVGREKVSKQGIDSYFLKNMGCIGTCTSGSSISFHSQNLTGEIAF